MKKRILSRAFALFMALSLLSTTAFAADYVAEVMLEGQTRDQITDDQRYEDLQTALRDATANSTVYLLEDNHIVDVTGYSIGIGIYMWWDGQTLDLDNKTLIIQGDGQTVVTGVSANAKNDTTIQNGTIVVEAEDTNIVFGIIAEQGEMTLNGVTLESKTGFYAAAGTNNGTLDLIDCTILEGAIVAEDEGDITVHSGVYGELGDNVELAEGSENKANDYLDEEAAKGTKVIVNKDTAAVVVDSDGTAHTYSDLEKAAEKVGTGATVNVVKGEAPEGYEIKDGKLVKAEEIEEPGTEPEEPGTEPEEPGTEPVEPTPNPPVVVPGIEGPGEMSASVSGPAAVEVSESDIPLAGLITRAQLVSYLYEHEGSPDGADAEGEYTLAMAWAVANGIVDEEDDPEEIVTVAILTDVMTNYAAYLDAAFDVVIEGEDDMVVMNCDEILAEFYASVEAEAA